MCAVARVCTGMGVVAPAASSAPGPLAARRRAHALWTIASSAFEPPPGAQPPLFVKLAAAAVADAVVPVVAAAVADVAVAVDASPPQRVSRASSPAPPDPHKTSI